MLLVHAPMTAKACGKLSAAFFLEGTARVTVPAVPKPPWVSGALSNSRGSLHAAASSNAATQHAVAGSKGTSALACRYDPRPLACMVTSVRASLASFTSLHFWLSDTHTISRDRQLQDATHARSTYYRSCLELVHQCFLLVSRRASGRSRQQPFRIGACRP